MENIKGNLVLNLIKAKKWFWYSYLQFFQEQNPFQYKRKSNLIFFYFCGVTQCDTM